MSSRIHQQMTPHRVNIMDGGPPTKSRTLQSISRTLHLISYVMQGPGADLTARNGALILPALPWYAEIRDTVSTCSPPRMIRCHTRVVFGVAPTWASARVHLLCIHAPCTTSNPTCWERCSCMHKEYASPGRARILPRRIFHWLFFFVATGTYILSTPLDASKHHIPTKSPPRF